jgi:hypothetical protein
MARRNIFSVLLVSVAGLVSVAAPAADKDKNAPLNANRIASCFSNHKVTRVMPYYQQITSAYGAATRLAGARVYIPAEPGLTEEWLHYELAQRIASDKSDAACPLDLPRVSVDVESSGPGFWVNISAAGDKQAQAVLKRAQRLVK